jgi:hypothetical protein
LFGTSIAATMLPAVMLTPITYSSDQPIACPTRSLTLDAKTDTLPSGNAAPKLSAKRKDSGTEMLHM